MKRLNTYHWRTKAALLYKTYTKRLRLIKVDRELSVFFLFLCVAIVFWFLQVMKEKTTMTFDYQLRIQNIPANIIITSDVPDEVTATIESRGFDLLEYAFTKNDRTIVVDFSELIRTDINLSIDNNLWRRLLIKKLDSNLHQIHTTPPTLMLSYSNGQRKRVPVVYSGKCTTGTQYTLRQTIITPDSVDVYAPSNKYDSINVIYTEPRRFNDVERPFTVNIPLSPDEGVKVIPENVDIHFLIEMFTEKTITVPIYCENTPDNKIVRTFPMHTSVTFRITASEFDNITAEDFLVTIDYNLLNAKNKDCQLHLSSVPAEASHVRLSPSTVEYVIEKSN